MIKTVENPRISEGLKLQTEQHTAFPESLDAYLQAFAWKRDSKWNN